MANGLHKYTVQEAQNAALGQAGYDLVAASGSNVTINSDTYVAITAITEAVVTTVSADTNIWDTLTSLTLPVGVTIYGRWTSVTIADGDTAIIYRG